MIFLIIDYDHSPFRQYQELQTIVRGPGIAAQPESAPYRETQSLCVLRALCALRVRHLPHAENAERAEPVLSTDRLGLRAVPGNTRGTSFRCRGHLTGGITEVAARFPIATAPTERQKIFESREPMRGAKPLKTDLRLLLVDWRSNTDLEEMVGPHKSRIGEVRGHGPDARGKRRGSQKAISGGRLLSVSDYR